MTKFFRPVLLGLVLSLFLAGVIQATSGSSPQRVNTGDNGNCHWGCCLAISGWCVWTCIICDPEVPSQ